MLERLVRRQRPAELVARAQVGDGVGEATLARARAARRPGSRPRSAGPRSTSPPVTTRAGAPSNVMSVRRRVMSRDSDVVRVTPSPSASTIATPSSTGTSSTSAVTASATAGTVPCSRSPPPWRSTVIGTGRPAPRVAPTASAAVRSPAATAPSRSSTASADSMLSSSAVATAAPRNGTGAAARPSSSATTAASRQDAPAPPRSSGTARPATPISPVRRLQRSVSTGSAVSVRLRTASQGACFSTSARTLARRSSSMSE